MEDYAKQKVIEELERLIAASPYEPGECYVTDEICNKLKQLKLPEEVDNRSLLEREHKDFPINRKELKRDGYNQLTGNTR